NSNSSFVPSNSAHSSMSVLINKSRSFADPLPLTYLIHRLSHSFNDQFDRPSTTARAFSTSENVRGFTKKSIGADWGERYRTSIVTPMETTTAIPHRRPPIERRLPLIEIEFILVPLSILASGTWIDVTGIFAH